jgi:tetratricopeptide (TPR) repeat protein
MKIKFSVLLLIVFSYSCAHRTHEFAKNVSVIRDKDQDLLSGESFIRYSEPRLENLNTNKNYTAISFCHNGDVEKGLEQLKEKYSEAKLDPEYWNNIGTCYYLKGDISKAKFYYNTAISTAKDKNLAYPFALNNLGVMYLKLRQYELAYESFSNARKLSPDSLTPVFNLAQFHLSFAEYNNAYEILLSLYQKNPKDVDILSSLGTLHLYKKDYNTAISYFSKIQNEHLNRADIATHYAMALYQIGDYEKAILIVKESKTGEIEQFKAISKELEALLEEKLEKLEEVKEKTAKLKRG